MKRRVYAFDFDGTVTVKDSLPKFIVHALGWKGYFLGTVKAAPWLVGYVMGMVGNSKAKERLFAACFKGKDKEWFESKGREFAERVLPGILRKETVERLREAVAEGGDAYIVSASMGEWILPWASGEGVKGVIATDPEYDEEGMLTGRFATPNCHGKEKVRRLLESEPARGDYELIAYGDSKGDSALLGLADEAYLVKDREILRLK